MINISVGRLIFLQDISECCKYVCSLLLGSAITSVDLPPQNRGRIVVKGVIRLTSEPGVASSNLAGCTRYFHIGALVSDAPIFIGALDLAVFADSFENFEEFLRLYGF